MRQRSADAILEWERLLHFQLGAIRVAVELGGVQALDAGDALCPLNLKPFGSLVLPLNLLLCRAPLEMKKKAGTIVPAF